MAIEFTEEQKKVIELHHENILVSAAAGSGKTAVLVERIIQMVSSTSEPVDIDKLLVVTFTNAAAAEMRERISSAIASKLAKAPENDHLQKQSALIHNAQITTIDSFCLFLIRNHFQDIGLDPAFRVADEGEMELLKQDVLAELLEEQYEEKRDAFVHCVECYSTGKRETVLEQSIFSLFRFSMSYPWPIEWLTQHQKDYDITTKEELTQSDFVQYGRRYLHLIFPELKEQMVRCQKICEMPDGPYMYGENVDHTIEQLERCVEATNWMQDRSALELVTFNRLPIKKDDSVDPEKRELAKNIRNMVKKQIEGLKEQFFLYSDEAIVRQCLETAPAMKELINLTILFIDKFTQAKRDRNIVDFSDMEHMALQILCRKEGNHIIPTETALEYQEYFSEIMVDEYQDSNLVQESILQSIARTDNRFMVGDVKQSIYRFRLARPELFMEKYHTYHTEDGPNRRIDLHQNFRSRKEVLDSVNILFEQLMDESLGGITYDAAASLRLGAVYPRNSKQDENKAELILREKDKESELTSVMQEAVLVAEKIQELCAKNGGHVTDKVSGEIRGVEYRDIVILLRSSTGVDEEFKKALEQRDIPCYISSKTGYFSTSEISLLMQLLRILDNPMQDIPLFGVMHSFFGSFSDEDLAKIKAERPMNEKLYSSLLRFANDYENDNSQYEDSEIALRIRCQNFIEWINTIRKKTVYMSISELMEMLLEDSHYLEYVSALPAGDQRRANVLMLLEKAMQFERTSFKGLYHFIRYIDQLEKYDVDYGEASMIDENANVVRIMTIHKSKGLEFPICFVSCIGKKMNRRDLASPILTDIDMGIGTDMIDPELRIRSKTLRKNILSKKMLLDNQAEEMRVLYVACTRAKEKLILTGMIEEKEKLEQDILPYINQNQKLLPFSFRSGATSYLNWIFAAFYNTDIKISIQAAETQKENVDKQKKSVIDGVQTFITQINTGVMNQKMKEKMQNRFSYQYPHQDLKDLYAKTTVSELKHAGLEKSFMKEDEIETGLVMFEEDVAPYLPSFLQNEESVSGSMRGSAMHRFMELINMRENQDDLSVRKQLAQFVKEKRMTTEYENALELHKVLHFLGTPLAKKMQEAQKNGNLHREQPFVLGIEASRLKPELPKEEMVLVQGIIDAYIEESDGLILLDYKTDAVKIKQDLINRYKVQLDYYAEALERITGKKVKQKVIYSFFLECEIIL